MIPLSAPVQSKLWQLACVHDVERAALHQAMGMPHFTESNSFATYGGEEDWWGYRLRNGFLVVICFRVPYHDIIICSDQQLINDEILNAFGNAMVLGKLEVYPCAYPA